MSYNPQIVVSLQHCMPPADRSKDLLSIYCDRMIRSRDQSMPKLFENDKSADSLHGVSKTVVPQLC